jgi:ABC-type polysaccharide/polyol phosphate transport system ATPase subunit
MSESVIHVEGLGKRYRVGKRESYRALRDVLTRALKAPFGRSARKVPDDLWALRDVSFDVKQGEVVGLIGRNGAGKTTLLKLLARITRPTTGFADIHGRVGSLLEVGTGFHPELTGRENVYLSGAILGMTKREINRKYEAIVDFAGVERFIDTPLKHYSSGMQTRLAFAVAAHLEPEILLVDEVLAVGDLEFQKKCMGKMEEVSESGRTIVFVSHQMNQIRRLCQRVIWIDGGTIRNAGPTRLVIGAYETAMRSSSEQALGRDVGKDTKTRFQGWKILHQREEHANLLSSFGPVTFRFVLQVNNALRMATHGIALYSGDGQLLWGTAAFNLELEPGCYGFDYELPSLPLRPGAYQWRVSLYDETGLVDVWECVPDLLVATEPVTHPRDEWSGILNIPYQFQIAKDDTRIKFPATATKES